MSFWPNLATLGELGTAETINPMTTVRVKLVRAADIDSKKNENNVSMYKYKTTLKDMQFNLFHYASLN